MMYKAIVVDDEQLIRDGITRYISSKKLGIEVISSFSDGRYALEYLRDNDVDIVITDIKMTYVSGLELAKFLFENKPYIKTVIISGYKEFEYAQQAIIYNVKNYILKPTNFKQFEKVLLEILQELENEKSLNESRQKYNELLPMLKEEFISDLLIGGLTDKAEIGRKINLLGLNPMLFEMPCMLVNVSVDMKNNESDWYYGKEGLQNFLGNIFLDKKNFADLYKVSTQENLVKICLIAKFPMEKAQFLSQAKQYFLMLKNQIEQIIQFSFSFEIKYAFDSFRLMLSDKIFDNEQEVFDEKIKSLLSHLMSDQHEEAMALMNSYLMSLSSKPLQTVKDEMGKIINALFDSLGEKTNLKFKEASVAELAAARDIQAVYSFCGNLITELSGSLSGDGADAQGHILSMATKYIEENYYKDISLTDVASMVFLNSSYFSRFFKKYMGENFSDYLIRVRMKHAVELLKQNYKVDDISRLTGYNSSRYFSRTFKAYYGMSPKEYARRTLE